MKRLAPAAFVIGTSTLVGCATPSARVDHPATQTAPLPARDVAELPHDAKPGNAAATDAQPTSPAPNDATSVAVPMEGSDHVRGKATIKVQAPIDKVREQVFAFAQYPEFMPHYKKAKVLGRAPSGGRDVYMEIEALNGAVTLWTRVDVPRKPVVVDGTEVYETKYLDGNVKDFKAIWRMKPIDDATTELSLEVYLEPRLPLPTSILNGENLRGAAAGVTAMRARIEGK
ncbi:MAG TPA: SRPBCC family protein [Minicystis sp.]|nr:SRPBCC family protein [Minicystis sp.]